VARRSGVLAVLAVCALSACDSVAPKPGVLLSPSVATIEDGIALRISARLRGLSGAVLWTSSNTAVARVDIHGVVLGVSNGVATITAKLQSDTTMSAAATITVAGPPVTAVAVSPLSGVLFVGAGVARFVVQLRANDGRILSGRPVTWSDPDPSIASVSSQGVVTPRAPGGPLTVVATSEGHSGFGQVRVTYAATLCPFVTAIGIGQSARGTLALGSCELPQDYSYVNIYQFSLATDATVQIDLASTEFDTYLGLFGPTGFLTEDDDSGGGTNARIVRALKAGTYQVWANSKAPGQKGSYVLTVVQR
jgi:hypothetical protein